MIGVGCKCPAGYKSERDNQSFAICAKRGGAAVVVPKTDPPKTDPPKTDPPKADAPKGDRTKTLVDPSKPAPKPE